MYITSDHSESSNQIKENTNYKNTFITPDGCHVDIDTSSKCNSKTTSYWFSLALSDVIVTQCLKDKPIPGPTSAFSRYAGIYGLNKNVFRNAWNCSDVIPTSILGRNDQGNWMC